MYEHGFDEQQFSKFVPIVANDTVDSTNGVIGSRKKFRVMLLPLVLFANTDRAIDKTGSSNNSNSVNNLRQRTFLLDSVERSQLVLSLPNPDIRPTLACRLRMTQVVGKKKPQHV